MFWFCFLQIYLVLLHHGCSVEGTPRKSDVGDHCSDLTEEKLCQQRILEWFTMNCTQPLSRCRCLAFLRCAYVNTNFCNNSYFSSNCCLICDTSTQGRPRITRCINGTAEEIGLGLRYYTRSLEIHDIVEAISYIKSALSKRRKKLNKNRAEDIHCALNTAFGADLVPQWMRRGDRDTENIVTAIDETASQIGNSFNEIRNTSYAFIGSNIAVNFQRFRPRRLSYERFSSEKVYENSSLQSKASIEIPYFALCDDNDENCSVVVGVSIINNLAQYIHDTIENTTNITTNSSIASVLLSAYVYESEVYVERLKDNPLLMTFTLNTSHLEFDEENLTYECVFLDMETFMWNGSGIVTGIKDEENRINCTSTHLTSFAVLVSVNPATFASEVERLALKVVSYIGCVISIVFLIATIILLIILRKKLEKGALLYIHLNLSFSLLLALLVFVAGLETATSIPVLCIIVAALIQYFFMSTFFWMLGEGIMLYLLIVKVFGKLHTRWYLLLPFCWGIPLVIVGISAGVLYDDYYTTSYCWIRADPMEPAIWIFVIPMIIVILINSLILARTVCAIVKHAKVNKVGGDKIEVKNTELVKTTIKSSIILMPLLGVTWVIGLFAVSENTTLFAWLFTILNSFQGFFIFLLHVMRSSIVRKAIKDWFGILIMKSKSLSMKSSSTIDAKTSKV